MVFRQREDYSCTMIIIKKRRFLFYSAVVICLLVSKLYADANDMYSSKLNDCFGEYSSGGTLELRKSKKIKYSLVDLEINHLPKDFFIIKYLFSSSDRYDIIPLDMEIFDSNRKRIVHISIESRENKERGFLAFDVETVKEEFIEYDYDEKNKKSISYEVSKKGIRIFRFCSALEAQPEISKQKIVIWIIKHSLNKKGVSCNPCSYRFAMLPEYEKWFLKNVKIGLNE